MHYFLYFRACGSHSVIQNVPGKVLFRPLFLREPPGLPFTPGMQKQHPLGNVLCIASTGLLRGAEACCLANPLLTRFLYNLVLHIQRACVPHRSFYSISLPPPPTGLPGVPIEGSGPCSLALSFVPCLCSSYLVSSFERDNLTSVTLSLSPSKTKSVREQFCGAFKSSAGEGGLVCFPYPLCPSKN